MVLGQADLRAVVVEVAVVAAAAEESWIEVVEVVQGSGVQIVVPDLGNFLVERRVRLICRPRSVAPC